MNVRLLASRIIHDVVDGHSLTDRLNESISKLTKTEDKSFVKAICYGVCRYYFYLDIVLEQLLKKPMRARDCDIHCLLLVGLYQLIFMRVPEYAAISETTNAMKQLKKSYAPGLCNAILREYLRQKDSILKKMTEDEEGVFSHPRWWIQLVKKTWPSHWEAILLANNAHPPMALRVNQRLILRDVYLEKLKEQNILADVLEPTLNGVVLKEPCFPENLPGFFEGWVFVQDGAAQLAAHLLQLGPNQNVLDACAAPGGKLTHILECESHLASCIAVEKNKHRIHFIEENLQRTKTTATVYCADVNQVSSWWQGELFDRILLDAPCSASGVVRRHPDIKLLRQASDIPVLAKEQTHLLESLWPLLKPGGILVYATCSIFKEENEDVMNAFLAQHIDAKEMIIEEKWGEKCLIGRQILPGILDGFYYARIRKEPVGG